MNRTTIRAAILILSVLAPLAGSASLISEREIGSAATKSIDQILTASRTWFEEQTCPSYHHRDLLMMVFGRALCGAAARLEDWFDPARPRHHYVPGGFKGTGGESRPVPGLGFGFINLPPADKRTPIAFQRTL